MSYVTIISKTVQAVSEKYSNPKRVSHVWWNWSNWVTNLYLDCEHNHISPHTMYGKEIRPILPKELQVFPESDVARETFECIIKLFQSIAHLQPMLTHEQVGVIVTKLLKGEI